MKPVYRPSWKLIPILAVSILFWVVLIVGVKNVFAEVPAHPDGRVSDFANILSKDVKIDLEKSLKALDDKTTIELVVVTVPSLDGRSVEDYSIDLVKTWKIGKADKNNGVIFLVAPNERKTRIEVGYGLEETLTDAKSKRILNEIRPALKKSIPTGVVEGTNLLIQVLGGEVSVDSQSSPEEHGVGTVVLIIIIIVIVILIVVAVGGGFEGGGFSSGGSFSSGGDSGGSSWGGGGGSSGGGGASGGW